MCGRIAISRNPGANVALLNAMAHVIVAENLHDEAFIRARCEADAFEHWLAFISEPRHSPESLSGDHRSEPGTRCGRRRDSTPPAATPLSTTASASRSTARDPPVMAIANLAMLTGNIGRDGVGVNPMRGQNNVQGSCDMGSFPHELPGYRHLSDAAPRPFEQAWGVTLDPEPGMRIPNMFDAALEGQFRGLYCQGEDMAQSDPNTQHIEAALASLECLVVQDHFPQRDRQIRPCVPARRFELLEKNGTFTNAERRISPVRKVMPPLSGKEDWEVTAALANAMGCTMNYRTSRRDHG